MKNKKPEIHAYHDYREFLRDWLAYRKASQSRFTVREFSKRSGIAQGYITMVLSGARSLSLKALDKISVALELTESELMHLRRLVTLSESGNQEAQLGALSEIQRSRAYRKLNPKEFEAYRYLSHWYYVAIRELAALPEFRLDAEWIQQRLEHKVSVAEVISALDFLFDQGFMQLSSDGSVSFKKKQVDCMGGVYRLALARFHSEMLGMAAKSIAVTERERRHILGHTFAIPEDRFGDLREILEDTLKRIQELGSRSVKPESVFHVALCAYPLTHKKERKS